MRSVGAPGRWLIGMRRVPPQGVAAVAISAWAADQCNKASGQELSADEGESHAASVEAVKGR